MSDPESRMRMRVIRLPDEVVLVDVELDRYDDIEAAGTAHAETALAAEQQGYGWALAVMDPDGEVAPPGEWLTLMVRPAQPVTR